MSDENSLCIRHTSLTQRPSRFTVCLTDTGHVYRWFYLINELANQLENESWCSDKNWRMDPHQSAASKIKDIHADTDWSVCVKCLIPGQRVCQSAWDVFLCRACKQRWISPEPSRCRDWWLGHPPSSPPSTSEMIFSYSWLGQSNQPGEGKEGGRWGKIFMIHSLLKTN